MDHRAQIEDGKRAQRIASATTEDEKALAGVESAVVASRAALDKLAAELSDQVAQDRMTQTVATEKMAEERSKHQALIQKYRQDIVDPIAAKIENIDPVQPESDGNHREAREDFEAMTPDEQDHALIKAMRGDDPVMAAALLGGRRWFSDTTISKLRAAITPPDVQEKQRSMVNLDKKVRDTLNTIQGALR